MANALEEKSMEQIDSEYKELMRRHSIAVSNHNVICAELGAVKRQLKEQMDECKKAGFDPDNLVEDIRHLKEVLLLKMDTFDADLTSAENIMKPMLKSIGLFL